MQAPVTILFSHGNGEDIAFIYAGMQHLFESTNANVFFYDYTGYLDCKARKPTEEDCYADIDAAWGCVAHTRGGGPRAMRRVWNADGMVHNVQCGRYLTETLGIPAGRIVLYGRSLGSGPSCYLAERLSRRGTPPMGMILQVCAKPFLSCLVCDARRVHGRPQHGHGIHPQSALTSVYRVVVPSDTTLPFDYFPNVDRIPHVCPAPLTRAPSSGHDMTYICTLQIRCPIFMIHGKQDEIVPFQHSVELLSLTNPHYQTEPLWVDSAGHNDVEVILDCETPNPLYATIQKRLDEWVKR
jgi:fermentation-respiration switch protein FrsA (DUF1100 family)